MFGGAGYVGKAVSVHLKEEFEVVVADIRHPDDLRGINFEQCDVRDTGQVKGVLENASAALYFSVVQIPQIITERRLGYEVNVLGFQNVCEVALGSASVKGVLLSGTWHVFGEAGLEGAIEERQGFQPDRVEERARTYALCKIVQESIARLYDEIGAPMGKTFAVIRMGTVLGEGMPAATAASTFIKNGIEDKPLTPFSNSLHRPMLFVDIQDVCKAYAVYLGKILRGEIPSSEQSRINVVNVSWPVPLSILDLAEIVRDVVKEKTGGKVTPRIMIKDTGIPASFTEADKTKFKLDQARASSFLGLRELTSPRDSIARVVAQELGGNHR